MDKSVILTISCPDRMGIVAAVTHFLLEKRCNIVDSSQFGDRSNGRFFLRILFGSEGGADAAALAAAFAPIREAFAMEAEFPRRRAEDAHA